MKEFKNKSVLLFLNTAQYKKETMGQVKIVHI